MQKSKHNKENIEENTGLSAYQQREPMKKLVNLGIITEKSKGMPLQKWYSLNSKRLYKLLYEDEALIASDKEIKEHDVKKVNTNNNNINNKKNNKFLYNNNQKIKFKDKVFLSKKEYSELIKAYGKEKIDNLITRISTNRNCR